MRNIVLFGPPGAGKGTQSEKLIEKYHLLHIATGDLFRKHLSEGTELGKKAQGYMDAGNLVPDEVVIGMVEDHLKHHNIDGGVIFDGFPRTVPQAAALDSMLARNDLRLDGCLKLEVPEDELVARLKNRGKTSGRTDDQDEEKIHNRLRVYQNETLPVAEFYQQQGKLHEVDGLGTIEEIFDRLSGAFDQL